MALWCRDLPLVRIARASTPRPFTLVVPYYEQPVFFARQLADWAALPPELAAHVTVCVVDDGSPTRPATAVPRPPLGITFRLFRIGVDVRWNWLAARNIGMQHAAEGWCLLTDMDHVVPAETMHACVYGVHNPRIAYAFSRREHTGAAIHPHSASFFLTRELFWQVGGYDEALAGYYGTDGDWRRRVAVVAPIVILTDELVRHEFVDDASVMRYQRKQPEDAAVRALIAARRPGWRPRVLSFPYAEVTQAVPS